jgi:hypothetical protein
VIVADAQAQAYVLKERYGNLEARACAYQSHRSYTLQNAVEGGEVPCELGCPPLPGTVAVGGVMVAFADNVIPSSKYGSCYCGEWHVVVRNLLTGRVLRREPTGGSKLTPSIHNYNVPEPGDYVGVGPALDVVVKGDGSVAWIVHNHLSSLVPPKYEVHVVDRLGSRIVASNPDIGPSSLALAGSTLYWTQDGKPFSALLN